MTKFPKRDNNSYFTREEKEEIMKNDIRICDCGHADFEHRLLEDNNNLSECHTCKCPFFNFQHKSTMRTYLSVLQEYEN